jgi:hypothetical protein
VWETKRPYYVIRGEPANYELAMVMGDFLVIHNEVAVFTANVIRLSALEKFGLYTESPVSVGYLRVGEMGKEKAVLWKPTSFETSPSNGPVIIHILTASAKGAFKLVVTDSVRHGRVIFVTITRAYVNAITTAGL